MKYSKFYETKTARAVFLAIIFWQFFAAEIHSQTKTEKPAPPKTAPNFAAPKVTQIDGAGLKNVLKASGKPLLVNFWATWCDPCREEFPELVKINDEYKGKIDFVTVSLDEVEEINAGVPKFLTEMKAEMPAYLLTTQDEDALISYVSKDWQGGLPFTILYDATGKPVYTRMGKVKIDVLRVQLEKLLSPAPPPGKTVK